MINIVRKNQQGVTLLEVILVMVVLLIIFAFSSMSIQYFRKTSFLDNSVQEVLALISGAQSKTIAGVSGLAYKVSFTASTARLLSETGTVVSTTTLDSNTEIVLPSPDIVFNKVTATSSGGTVTIRLKDLSKSRSIVVSQQGRITVN